MKLFLYIVILVLYAATVLSAGQCPPDSQDSVNRRAGISVKSNVSGIGVYLDSLFLGNTPLDSVKVDPGRRIIRFIHPDNRNWLNQTVIETVQLKSSENVLYDLTFPHVCRISTIPFDATVAIGDSVLGKTPLILPMMHGNIGISITKSGFKDISANLSSESDQFVVELVNINTASSLNGSLYLAPTTAENNTAVYVTSGATVAAGIFAAYCKIQADKYYRDYQHTGDGSKLNKVRHLDRASGISLVVTEIGFFLLSYLIFSR